ncbi:hypothetical protein BpHYR1_027151 [Brachionus plicatilis]|uniref:Uncharacterized protein n=1 Tax=Brachionus plicatilis TaxID=10195 RepID=A0A3M7QFJ9_BRAPC|nr:hypothetical protein BpHYR1_027151 [Brachionus plicatilis]
MYLVASRNVSILVNFSSPDFFFCLLESLETELSRSELNSDIKNSNGKCSLSTFNASFRFCMRFLSRLLARTRRCLFTINGIMLLLVNSSSEFIMLVNLFSNNSLLYLSEAHGLPRHN